MSIWLHCQPTQRSSDLTVRAVITEEPSCRSPSSEPGTSAPHSPPPLRASDTRSSSRREIPRTPPPRPRRRAPPIASSNLDAVRNADVVIPAIYFGGMADLAREIGPAVAGLPVVDVSNRIAFGETGPAIDTTSSNAEELAALFPASPVVKAFNTLFASNQVDPVAEGVRLDGFVAGDDAAAKATVLELVALDRSRAHRRRARSFGRASSRASRSST